MQKPLLDDLKKHIDEEEVFDEVPLIFTQIHGLLFHSTGFDGLTGIINDRCIRPQSRGVPARWKLAQGATTYGHKHGYVCLFDFLTTKIEHQLKFPSQWHNVVLAHSPFNFIIELDYNQFRENIVPNEVAVAQYGYSIKFIPYVEVWSKSEVSLDSFLSVRAMQTFLNGNDHMIEKFNINGQLLSNIPQYMNDIRSSYAKSYEQYLHMVDVFGGNYG